MLRSSARWDGHEERRDLTDSLAVFRFAPDGGVPSFEAGQFLMLGLGDRAGEVPWRADSIASPPEEHEHVELYIRRSEGDEHRHLTRELWHLGVGDAVFWKPPRGRFAIADRGQALQGVCARAPSVPQPLCPRPTAPFGALQHVHVEHALHQLGPRVAVAGQDARFLSSA